MFAVVFARLLRLPAAINVGTVLETPASIDFRAGIFAWGVTVVAILAFGLLPAALTSSRSPIGGHVVGATYWSTSRGFQIRQLLLALQVSLSVVLIAVAVLHAKSLLRIESIAYPYPTGDVLMARINATALAPDMRRRFYRDLMRQLRSQGAVTEASLSSTSVMSPGGARVQATLDAPVVDADYVTAGSRYFAALGIPLQAGRPFHEDGERDDALIMNVPLAARLWPGESAVGRQVRLPGIGPREQIYTVVGVVNQPRCRDMSSESPCVYLPVPTDRPAALIVYLRTRVPPASFAPGLYTLVSAMSTDVVVDQTMTLGEHMQVVRTGPRVAATMTVGTALLATLLSAIGCAALLLSLVREAQREIASRLALGSTTKWLTRHIMSRALAPCALGIAVGLWAAWVGAGWIGDQLYETNVHDPLAFIAPAVLLICVGAAASYVPIRLATRISPAALLRQS